LNCLIEALTATERQNKNIGRPGDLKSDIWSRTTVSMSRLYTGKKHLF